MTVDSTANQKLQIKPTPYTEQKMEFLIKDYFNNCTQICWKLWIWSYLRKKTLMENFSFCVVIAFL